MISEDVVFDRFMADLDAQIEVLSSIAGDNRILTEQLRLLLESRELVYQQAGRLSDWWNCLIRMSTIRD